MTEVPAPQCPGRDADRAIERAGPNDLMQLAFDVGPVPMQMGAVLLLEPGGAFDPKGAVALLGQRLVRVPRLRQRLVRPAIGGGRPFWLDDPTFDIDAHITVSVCPSPRDESALIDFALSLATSPLPESRPLWSATFVTGLSHGRVGLVLVLHHVVADGLGGLAVLGELVDGSSLPREMPPAGGFPRPSPSHRALVIDAWRSRARRLPGFAETLWQMVPGAAELGTVRPGLAPRTSLNRPSGARRQASVVRADLSSLLSAAHAQGGTVNDVILTAVTGALGHVLAARGEHVSRLVVSVPVSSRTGATRDATSNHVGVTAVALPLAGEPRSRLKAVAAITRPRKRSQPGSSATLLQPTFRVLRAMGVLKWVMNHQRLVNTFVTNMRGPITPMTFMSAPIAGVVPISGISGNVTAAFAALSYAGTLTVTVIADPDAVPELDDLTAHLQHELDVLVSPSSPD